MSTFPLEPQIRKSRTGKQWDGGSERLIKDSRVECQMGERETEKRRGRGRNQEAYLWLWPETAVSLPCVEDGSSLISSPSCHSICVASLLSSEGQRPTSSLERERKSIRLSNQSLQWRRVFYKRTPSCKCLLALLFCKDLDRNGRCSFTWYCFFYMTLWQLRFCSDTADLTLSRKSFLSPVLVVMLRFWPVISSWRLPPAHHSCHPENTRKRRREERRGEERI